MAPCPVGPVGEGAIGSSMAICPICYEELKPLVEDLQSISICGHVFHELCLQQWLEYCRAGKGCTCPVCKRPCKSTGVTRLYFQSTGIVDPSQQPIPSEQKSLSGAEAEALCGEISKLQGKLSAIGAVLEAQKNHVEELNSEIAVWKERAKEEEEMKAEHRHEAELVRRLLRIKEAELSQTTEECARLQERSLVLAKELAALKLAMDVNLEEEDIAKLASIGHGTRHADAIDVLQRSLFLRNKSYKELMVQCNLLGRSEMRSLKKLEKAEEKIKKLKAHVQDLEKNLEKRGIEMLKSMKDQKGKGNSHIGGGPSEAHSGNSLRKLVVSDKSLYVDTEENVLPVCVASTNVDVISPNNKCGSDSSFSQPIDMSEEINLGDKFSGARAYTRDGSSTLDESINVVHMATATPMVTDDDFELATFIPIVKQASVDGSRDPLLPIRENGHGNANKFAGKWCKARGNPTMQTSTGSGSLIAVGADGRGGRIKVLRTHDRLEGRAQSLWPKKCKYGVAQVPQSEGCLRIEQFFGKIER